MSSPRITQHDLTSAQRGTQTKTIIRHIQKAPDMNSKEAEEKKVDSDAETEDEISPPSSPKPNRYDSVKHFKQLQYYLDNSRKILQCHIVTRGNEHYFAHRIFEVCSTQNPFKAACMLTAVTMKKISDKLTELHLLKSFSNALALYYSENSKNPLYNVLDKELIDFLLESFSNCWFYLKTTEAAISNFPTIPTQQILPFRRATNSPLLLRKRNRSTDQPNASQIKDAKLILVLGEDEELPKIDLDSAKSLLNLKFR